MLLSQNTPAITHSLPASLFSLPEKILQFGTGVLLRGLPDYFIDIANKQGLFGGRIVVVKSTAAGSTDSFAQQDNLYTICINGIADGAPVQHEIINASISRVLSATSEWKAILECAENPEMQIVISNTTEVGIVLINDDIKAEPPTSFPGKLLAFLYRRYQVFNGDETKGMVIIPTELLPDNGDKLKGILLQLAAQNNLKESFINWLQNSNHFCSSLVDCIVPGKLPAAQKTAKETALNYEDELMITSEPYRLWAIQSGSHKVKEILSFHAAHEGVVIAEDITMFRELKLRLLNGSHTFTCGLAFLAGFATVKEAMDSPAFAAFIQALMIDEIVPAITTETITEAIAQDFAYKVLDRYRNPFIEHKWLSITLQYSSKMAMRNIPVILAYVERFEVVPQRMALGFAAHILFMQSTLREDNKYYGDYRGSEYAINDDQAAFYAEAWEQKTLLLVVQTILANQAIWGLEANTINGFASAVTTQLEALIHSGAAALINQYTP